MAVAVWPATLPQGFEKSDYSEGQGDGRIRSEMDAGPAKVRMRFRPPRPVTGSMLMTPAQLATMRTFIDADLSGGVLPFYFPNQTGSGNWLCRIGDSVPNWTSAGHNLWKVTLSFEVLPQ